MSAAPAPPEPPSPTGPELILSVGGMHCASSVGRVERALQATPVVSTATVNLASARA
jgi:copper chaperone CopZ